MINPAWIEACAALLDQEWVSLNSLVRGIAPKYGTNLREMRSHTRAKNVCRARLEFYAAARDARKSPCAIGRFINRDHSTVIHGDQSYRRRMAAK